jgi:para-nitrobenzyl esterase
VANKGLSFFGAFFLVLLTGHPKDALCQTMQASAPVVRAKPINIQSGEIQGVRDGDLTIYRGIAYAAPPVGDLRWRAPQPVMPWQGVRDAAEFGPACMQKGPTLPGMMEHYSEDCLYLNVWTPARTASEKLAVMVYLYGGGSTSGSGSVRLYWGDHLAKRGVVVVTFNYRLGSLGTLAHPELTRESGYHASGNYNLLDIIAALRWVKDNIAAFGGDPNNVTLFGQSAGAYWSSILMVSPQAQGLFRRVIASSGGEMGTEGAKDSFPALAKAERTGMTFVAQAGVRSIAEMRRIPADKIVAMDSEVRSPDGVNGINSVNIDGYVIPEEVRALYLKGREMHVDLLVGSNADEGVNTLGPPASVATYIKNIKKRYGDFADRFLALYPASSDPEAAQSQMQAKSDDTFWRAATWARLHARAGNTHVYLYRITTIPPFGPWPKLGKIGHGAELPYVFGYPSTSLLEAHEGAAKAALHTRIENEIQSYWTNFAKTGDPNGPGLPRWPRFELKTQKAMDMGDNFVAVDLPERAAVDLLDAYHAARR